MIGTTARTPISLPEQLEARLDALALRMEMDRERALSAILDLAEMTWNTVETLGGEVYADINGVRYVLTRRREEKMISRRVQ